MRVNSGGLIAILVMIQFFFLIIQFILGMWINLFAPMNIPVSTYGGYVMGFMAIFFQVPGVIEHMMNGMLIGLIALIILFASIFAGKPRIIVLAAFNGILTLTAGIGGMYFVLSGLSNNMLSLTMAIGFIGVISTDFSILYISSGKTTVSVPPRSNAINILKLRLAKGEITKEQFNKMMRDLGE